MAPGSSPRIRGEFPISRLSTTVPGIIPANTGRMLWRPRWFGYIGDHPREYGENAVTCRFTMSMLGSSPRIRGEFNHVLDDAGSQGIIPANTGRIIVSVLPRIAERDHPREYGENSYSLAETQADLWIIPANTGRMKCHCLSTQGTRDHPREYGENGLNLGISAPLWGSSPRIRGEWVSLCPR